MRTLSWNDARQGLITSGLNHVGHGVANKIQENRIAKFRDILEGGTIEDLVGKLVKEKKGQTFTGKELRKKYNIEKDVGSIVETVRTLGDGKFDIDFKKTWLVNNSPSRIKINDGIVNVKKSSFPASKGRGYNGFTLSGAIWGKIDGIKYKNIFLNSNSIAGIKPNNRLTDFYGF